MFKDLGKESIRRAGDRPISKFTVTPRKRRGETVITKVCNKDMLPLVRQLLWGRKPPCASVK